MPKKQRGGLHYNMNKGTNFRVDETWKTFESYCSRTTKREVKLFERVEYKCLMQPCFGNNICSFSQLCLRRWYHHFCCYYVRTLTSIDRIVKMYPLHVSVTIASSRNTGWSWLTSAKMKMCDNSISITLMTLRILLKLRNHPKISLK